MHRVFVSDHLEDKNNIEVDIYVRMGNELNWLWIICQAFEPMSFITREVVTVLLCPIDFE